MNTVDFREIKDIFNRYKKNIQIIEQECHNTVKGVDYSKVYIPSDKSVNHVEQLMIMYLINTEKAEREVRLVDLVYDYFSSDRDIELARLIDLRFRQGKPNWLAANGVYISERQAIRWLKKAYEKAFEIGREMNIFESKVT